MTYADSFYTSRKSTAQDSADRVVPWILDRAAVRSVVDFGCGTGSWLAAFREFGIADLKGFDGPWVPPDQLEISPEQFTSIDFEKLQEFSVDRRFDLVISLEVAEHISARLAPKFVEALTSMGSLILFSAAIPLQGGVGHKNEQWPNYWASMFRAHRFVELDIVRGAFWDDGSVAPWYAQNAFFFLSEDAMSQHPRLLREVALNSLAGKSLVHPSQYENKIRELRNPYNQSVKAVLKTVPLKVWRAIQRGFRANDGLR